MTKDELIGTGKAFLGYAGLWESSATIYTLDFAKPLEPITQYLPRPKLAEFIPSGIPQEIIGLAAIVGVIISFGVGVNGTRQLFSELLSETSGSEPEQK